MKIKQTLLTAAALSCFASSLSAAVDYSFLSQAATFDGKSSAIVPLTDATSGFSTNMTVSGSGGNLNSNATGIGIGDAIIDGTNESITFTFSTDIDFNFIDLGGVGTEAQAAAEGASLTIGLGSSIILYTDATSIGGTFDGSSDIYTPTSPIRLLAGRSIVLTGSSATSNIDLDAINFSVVPEPGTYALLSGICALGFVMLRRRSQ
ncbi:MULTISPECIES: PEP-CTERM sorting domain-containing protein [unclassified Lentimonas]|uniref:PEP-CTERM sorting domain-containing protein n=1 Tax=unclassified Lentimonas TaxID=2630993 RepID=UPI0013251E59|nr:MULTISPECIES: PEP-CTERM sorting domain-containing protein [unclassified Lentimonas]CAA6692578.1 Unannotated [Lentimonas sp. CC19]CAA6696936.1 Unannotated [Lentimonas sp. CC10]CAA7070977.1 Unannotated [Lentimonas sp. CC11]